MATPGDRPIVNAFINGRGPFKLGVETGNPSALTLYTDAVARLGPSAPDTSRGTPRVDSIRIGGLTLRDVDVFVPGPSSLPTQLDGQLGLAAYEQLLITIDWPHHRLRFSHDTLSESDAGDVVHVSPVGPIVGIPIQLGSRAGTFILDSQGGVGLSINPASYPQLSLVDTPATVGLVRSPALGSIPRRMARLADSAEMAGHTLERPLVTLTALPTGLPADGLIGIHTLKYFAVSLDQRSRRARLTRSPGRIPSTGGWWDRGIGVKYGRGPLSVLTVVPGSVGARAGIVEGDTILTAGGRATTAFAPSDWEPLAQNDQPLRLVVEHNGMRRALTVPPQLFVR
jgi:hypothetical protein